MASLALALWLASQPVPAAAPGTEVRALSVSFVDERGEAVADLSPADVAVTENGVTREITSFAPDTRPLSVAVIVDSSAALGSSYRLNVVEAVAGLVGRLPPGTRYSLWTSGERPAKLVDQTEEREAAGRALRRVAPQGGNYMLDALAEAASDLRKTAREGDRTAVIAVTSTGPELSYRDKYRSVEEARRGAELFLLAQIEGQADFDTRSNLGYTLDQLAADSGGRHEIVLSAMSVDTALRRLSSRLRSGYRVAYATVPGLEKRKLEFTIARPRTRAVVPAARVEKTEKAPRS